MQNLTIEQQNQINAEVLSAFQEMKRAAIRLGTLMTTLLPEENQIYVARANKSGAKLVLEVGPLPDVSNVDLVLVEPEGARYIFATQKDALLTKPQ